MKLIQELMKKEKLVVILLFGLLLMIVALPVKEKKDQEMPEEEKESENTFQEADWQEKMEERLTQVLEQVEGIGDTEVFLTCSGTEKKVVEKDETESVYEKDARGNQSPYVVQEQYPQVTGVLIAAKGGDNPMVVQNIREAVQALFQVEPHKIKVMKMN
nr:stage III sporulation protein AG [uncultured Blautia sp.]